MRLSRTKKRLIIPIAAIAASAVMVSCGKSIDTMIDEYNGTLDKDSGGTGSGVSNYVKDEGSKLGPGDKGFHEWDMLQDLYSVTDDGSLQLAAPDHGCKDWGWELFTYDGIGQIAFKPYNEQTKKAYPTASPSWPHMYRINIYVPDSGLKVGLYALRLTVTGSADNQPYKDTAIIAIYPRLKTK